MTEKIDLLTPLTTEPAVPTNHPARLSTRAIPLILSVVLLTFYIWHFLSFTPGIDYIFTFRAALVGWLNGQPVYAPPYYNFSNAPWLLLALLPLEALTVKGAAAALAMITVSGMLAGWRMFSRGISGYALPISLAVCFFNLHTFDLIFRNQIDVFVLFAVMILYIGMKRENGWIIGLGWAFAAIRPTSIILLLIFTLIWAFQKRLWVKALIVPLVALIASFVIFDPYWIARYYIALRYGSPPNPGAWLSTIWQGATYLQISSIFPAILALAVLAITVWALWRYRPDLRTRFALLVSASLIIVPYALSYHYSVMLVLFVPLLVGWRVWLALPFFLLTATPILRAVDVWIAWIDVLLPLFIWILVVFYSRQHQKQGS